MAGWPIQGDSTGDCDAEKRAALHIDEDGNAEDGMLRSLFDEVLLDLQIGFNVKNNNKRPIQAVLGNGESVDLFKLFWLVNEKGGLALVSNEYRWGSIGEKLGFNPKVSASLKLVYTKYLGILDRCLNRIFKDGRLSKNTQDDDGNLGLLALELEKRFQGLSKYEMKAGDAVTSLDGSQIFEQSDIAIKESLQIPVDSGEKINNLGGDITKVPFGDKDDSKIEGEEKVMTPDTSSRKRKREGLDQMLNWMNQVAKNPCDPQIGKIPNCSRWKENKGKKSWSLAIATRESLLKRKYPDSDHICPSLEKKQRVNPSMYDDSSATKHPDSLRSSRRIPVLAKAPLCSCCKGSVHQQNNLPSTHSKCNQLNNNANINHQKINKIDQSPLAKIEPPQTPVEIKLSHFDQQLIRKHVSVNVGPRYQAEVLPWTGQTSESDSRWLGTLVWPPKSKGSRKENERPHAALKEPEGKVCGKTCDCGFPGSVECVRFHTAEKRLKLKLELGRTFYQWQFHTMGEIVSLSWAPEEEEKFKEVMTTSPMLLRGKSSFLIKRTRKDLVDYYFNVFLQRKRCYQNRTTPKEIDSDDELSDFGAVGGLYGDVAIRASGLNPRACTLNEQCWDFFNEELS